MPRVDRVRRLFAGSKQRAFPNLSSAERWRYKSFAGQVKSEKARRSKDAQRYEEPFFKRNFVEKTAELEGMSPEQIFTKPFLQLDAARQDVVLNGLMRVFSKIGNDGGVMHFTFLFPPKGVKWNYKYRSKVKKQLATLQKSFERNSAIFTDIIMPDYLDTIDMPGYSHEYYGLGKSWHLAAHNLKRAHDGAKMRFKNF